MLIGNLRRGWPWSVRVLLSENSPTFHEKIKNGLVLGWTLNLQASFVLFSGQNPSQPFWVRQIFECSEIQSINKRLSKIEGPLSRNSPVTFRAFKLICSASLRLVINFLGFPVSLKQMLRWFSSPSCHYMLLMYPTRLKSSSNQFHVLFTRKITTATGWQPNCSK